MLFSPAARRLRAARSKMESDVLKKSPRTSFLTSMGIGLMLLATACGVLSPNTAGLDLLTLSQDEVVVSQRAI